MSVLLPHYERAEVGAPPPACGLQLGQYYRRALRKRFSIIALDTCMEGNLSVDCPSETLGTDSRIFLRLTYSYETAREMKLALSAYDRNSVGATTATQVPRDSRLAFAELWDELAEVARTCPAQD